MKLQESFERESTMAVGGADGRPVVAAKKILFVTKTYEYGGAERHLIDLLNRLCQPGLQMTVVCFAMDPFTERLGHCPNLAVRTVAKTPASLREWASFFRSFRADTVVFVYGWSWNFHWIAPIGAWLARVPRRYAIHHLVLPGSINETLAHRILQGIFGHLNLKISAATLDTTICVSDAVRNSLIQEHGFPTKTLKTIRNGVSLSDFAPSPVDGGRIRREYGIGSEEFLLVCPARLSDQKGIDILLNAVARSLQKSIHCKCIIVGDGPLREKLREQAQKLRLDALVIFAGFREDIRPYLHAASALILTSHREGLPLAILEAMAAGLPCIVTDVGGNSEAVTDKVNGLLIPAGSAEAAAEAISFLATQPEECMRMSQAALAKVQKEFDIEVSMAEIKQVILN